MQQSEIADLHNALTKLKKFGCYSDGKRSGPFQKTIARDDRLLRRIAMRSPQSSSKKSVFIIVAKGYGRFYSFIETLSQKLSIVKNSCFCILGDMNINLLGSDSVSNEYINVLSSHSAISLMDQLTRVAASSATPLDLIVTNDTSRKINPGIIRTDISDYFPVFCAVTHKLTSKNQRANKTFYRNMKRLCADDYREDLFSLLTNFVSTLPEITANNFNIIFYSFSKIVADAIN